MHTEHTIFVYGILLGDAVEPATLLDYRLAFNGHATVEREQGGFVLGGLIHTDDAGLRRYDSIEGVPSYYERVRVTVSTEYGAREVWVYRMRRVGNLRPDFGYVRLIERGYRRFGYPTSGLYEAAA